MLKNNKGITQKEGVEHRNKDIPGTFNDVPKDEDFDMFFDKQFKPSYPHVVKEDGVEHIHIGEVYAWHFLHKLKVDDPKVKQSITARGGTINNIIAIQLAVNDVPLLNPIIFFDYGQMASATYHVAMQELNLMAQANIQYSKGKSSGNNNNQVQHKEVPKDAPAPNTTDTKPLDNDNPKGNGDNDDNNTPPPEAIN